MEQNGSDKKKSRGKLSLIFGCGGAMLLFLATVGFLVFGYIYYVKLGK